MTTTPTQTVDGALEGMFRRVLKEELNTALGAPMITPTELYPLGQVVKRLKISKTTLKRLRKEGSLVPDAGEGRLARYSLERVKEALALHARATGAPSAKALNILGRRFDLGRRRD